VTTRPKSSRATRADEPRPVARAHDWFVAILNLLGVLVVYFMLPASSDLSRGRLVLDVLATAVGISLVATVLFREVRRQAHDPGAAGLSGLRLVLLLEIVLVIFAFIYYTVAINAPGQFTGLNTRIDSLYFSMVTTTTVGYGDIHATGQAARAMVIVQIGFDVAFIAVLSTLIRYQVRRNLGTEADGDD
jgi:voltage-gated potassium channel Kch